MEIEGNGEVETEQLIIRSKVNIIQFYTGLTGYLGGEERAYWWHNGTLLSVRPV